MNIITLPKKVASSQHSVASSLPPPTQSSVLSLQSFSPPTLDSRPPTPLLVGRDAELTHLHSLLAKAMSGERQIVFIAGEAGIGKTTLVDVFLAQLRDRIDVRISSGQCVEQYGPGEAYMPLLEAIVGLCRGPSRERRIEDLKRYAPSLLVQLPGLLDAAECARLQERLQGTSRERMLREMAQAAELFTARRGLVLVLEDLHWSDVSTLEWLSYIARRREPAKLFIIGTYRPTDLLASGHPLRGMVQELQSRRQCEELRVTPLSEEAIAEYLYSRFGEMALPETAATTLARRTGGNPLFVVNTVDYFVRQGAVTQEAGRWTLQVDKLDEVGQGIPDTLRQLIERQVERLSETEQRLLEVASVAGVEFTAADVAAGLSTAGEEVEENCERFARARQWVRAVGLTELPDGTVSGRYSFLHAMYQEVINARIAEIRRIQVHRRIAVHKEAVYSERAREIAAELAVHCEQGREYAKAVQYHRQAAEAAVRACASREAVSHLQHSLELLTRLPETPDRVQQELRVQLALGEQLTSVTGFGVEEVERAFSRARELCCQLGETPQLFRVVLGLWAFYVERAQLETARELAEQLLRFAQHAQQLPPLFVWAHLSFGITVHFAGDQASARQHLEACVNLYDPQHFHSSGAPYDPAVLGHATLGPVLWLLGYPEQAREHSQQGLALAQALSQPYSIVYAASLVTRTHLLRGELWAVHEHIEELVALCQEHGFASYLALSRVVRGWLQAEQGQQEAGITQMHTELATWRATGAESARPYYLALLAETYGKVQDADTGLAVLAECWPWMDKTGGHVFAAELYRLKGELTRHKQSGIQSPASEVTNCLGSNVQSPESEAEACFLQAIEIAQQQQAKSLELRAVMSLVRLRQQQALEQGARSSELGEKSKQLGVRSKELRVRSLEQGVHNPQHVTRSSLAEAHQMLSDVYNWFTEGFDTKDLQEAAALLCSLGSLVERTEDKTQVHGRTGGRENSLQEDDKQIIHSPIPPFLHSSSDAHLPAQSSVLSPQSFANPRSLTPDLYLPVPDPRPPAPNSFRSDGDYWTLSFAGTTCHLKDALGLHYIAHLLQHPHQEVHVITLLTTSAELPEEHPNASLVQDSGLSVSDIKGGSDAIEILDPQARVAYKQRLNELREELGEAQRFHDVGRSEQLAAEIDFLTHELANAVGLGGRARRLSQVERARVNISRAIKVSLRKITEYHPALGQHLTATIKTGAYCLYTPDPRVPVSWEA